VHRTPISRHKGQFSDGASHCQRRLKTDPLASGQSSPVVDSETAPSTGDQSSAAVDTPLSVAQTGAQGSRPQCLDVENSCDISCNISGQSTVNRVLGGRSTPSPALARDAQNRRSRACNLRFWWWPGAGPNRRPSDFTAECQSPHSAPAARATNGDVSAGHRWFRRFVVVARGGDEPPTFRFSDIVERAGQRPFSGGRAISRATSQMGTTTR
jgi:hypothetical protein